MTFEIRPPLEAPPAKVYPPEILPLMQSLLSSLARIDQEYEEERDALRRSTLDELAKQRAMSVLAQRHRQRREPYVREIHTLEDRIMLLMHRVG